MTQDLDDDVMGQRPDSTLPYKPKAPPRSPAPAVFKAWRQEQYGSMMTQVLKVLRRTYSTAKQLSTVILPNKQKIRYFILATVMM